jgi:Transglycosylase-like domain
MGVRAPSHYSTRTRNRPRPTWPQWWFRQAACIHAHESTDWHANTGNGYYGGMQFLASTYRAAGGRSDGRADLDSPRLQLGRAWLVWQHDGGSWREWGTARVCGLT